MELFDEISVEVTKLVYPGKKYTGFTYLITFCPLHLSYCLGTWRLNCEQLFWEQKEEGKRLRIKGTKTWNRPIILLRL